MMQCLLKLIVLCILFAQVAAAFNVQCPPMEDYNPVHLDENGVPPNPFYYNIGTAEGKVCGLERNTVLQPNSSQTGGCFYHRGVNGSQFTLRHIVEPCHQSKIRESCDQLWIETNIINLQGSGSFYIKYIPPDPPDGGGQPININVSYGVEGIMYIGSTSSDGSVPIPITNAGIEFEVRVHTPTPSPIAKICESINGIDYNQSSLLRAHPTRPIAGCIPARINTPYLIQVMFSPNNNNITLTPRMIVVTFGSCNRSSLLTSKPLYVVGAIGVGTTSSVETDSSSTTELLPSATPGSTIEVSPTARLTTTSTSETRNSEPQTDTPTSTRFQTITTPTNSNIQKTENPDHKIIGGIAGFAIILVIFCVTLIISYFLWKYKKKSGDPEKQCDYGDEELKSKESTDSKKAHCPDKLTRPEDTTVVHANLNYRHTPSPVTRMQLNSNIYVTHSEVESKVIESKCLQQNVKRGSFSGSEDGSEVALLKVISNHLVSIHDRVQDNGAVLENLSERVDDKILSPQSNSRS